MLKHKSRILAVDIETQPSSAFLWSLTNNDYVNPEMIFKEWTIICVCAKFVGEKKMYSFARCDYPLYKQDKDNDLEVVKDIYKLISEADCVLTHNGNRFDLKKIRSRGLYHSLKPFSPVKSIDTLQICKESFGMNSNKLGEIGKYLKIGQKKNTGGFALWKSVMEGDLKAWKKMIDYCKNDVLLLEKVYLRVLPYASKHPNVNAYSSEDRMSCPNCGSADMQKRGFFVSTNGKFQRYQCQECGCWSRDKKNLFSKEKIKNARVHI